MSVSKMFTITIQQSYACPSMKGSSGGVLEVARHINGGLCNTSKFLLVKFSYTSSVCLHTIAAHVKRYHYYVDEHNYIH